MARPRMEGMNYFPHDTDATNDEKLEALRALYKNDGYAFYFIICERVYRTAEAELNVSNPAVLAALINKIGITKELFNEILQTSFDVKLFDQEVFSERNVLTSNGIKKRANEVQLMRERWRNNKSQDNEEENKEENLEENSEETGESKGKESKDQSKLNQNEILINNADATLTEKETLKELSKIKSYPFKYEIDIDFIRELSIEYIRADILKVAKKFAITIRGKPFKKKSNPRLQFRNWVENDHKWTSERSKNNVGTTKDRGSPTRDSGVKGLIVSAD